MAGTSSLVVLLPLAMLRVTRVAADHRRRALRVITGLGGVWPVSGCSARRSSPTRRSPPPSPPASSSTRSMRAGRSPRQGRLRQGDQARPVPQDAHQPTANRLRGKDVLLVFTEAFGREAMEEPRSRPRSTQRWPRGTSDWQSAGFSSRSGFLDSATFGGGSWLAHSTLNAGLWVHNLRRYNQLIPERRFTLASAFNRAGWRTVDEDPRTTALGHRVRRSTTRTRSTTAIRSAITAPHSPMPRCPTSTCSRRSSVSSSQRPHRQPLFAEVDTISSHMPWNRIPEPIAWDQVGNGSIYNKTPMIHETGAFWGNPIARAGRVRHNDRLHVEHADVVHAALRQEESRDDRPGRPPAVADRQRDHSNHDVPISIIAHDPKVLKQIGSWGWNPGLKPVRTRRCGR